MIDTLKASTSNMRAFLSRFLSDENGSTAIEYALFAAGIGFAVLSSFSAMSEAVAAKYELIRSSMPG